MTTEHQNLTQQLLRIDAALRAAATEAAGQVRAQPDNPAIQRAGGSLRMFTMRSSDLGNNWTPFFHDWKAQYELVATLLEERKFGAVREILNTGKHRSGGTAHSTQHLAEPVLERIRSIVGDLQLPDDEPPAPTRSRQLGL